jgi:nicotinate-nucleotide--dimethylbenzimidazole phosphoribosyltransferase
VRSPDAAVRRAAAERLAGLATPPGALGRLGELAVWWSATQGQVPPPPVDHVRLVIFAGDHGVAHHGVSAFPPEITGAMVRTFVAGRAGVSALAAAHDVTVTWRGSPTRCAPTRSVAAPAPSTSRTR